MAKARKTSRRRRRSTGHKHSRRTRRSNPVMGRRRRRSVRRNRVHRRYRRNAVGGRVGGLLVSGVYVVGGAVGTRMLTQAVLGSKNTGVIGYGGNAVSALVLGWGVKKFLRNPHAGNMVMIGGFAALALRLIQDYTPLGSFVQAQLSGMGIRGDTGMGLLLSQSYVDPAIYDAGGAVMPGAWKALAAPPVVASRTGGTGMGRSSYRRSSYA